MTHTPAMSAPCPVCRAWPGQPCTIPSGKPCGYTHAARKKKYRELFHGGKPPKFIGSK